MPSVIMSQNASASTQKYFEKKGFNVVLFSGPHQTYDAVNDHPDMHLFYDGILFSVPEQNLPFEMTLGSAIGKNYPDNIKYNIAKVGSYIFCNYKYVDEILKEHIKKSAYTVLDVKQGYSKCSTAIVDDKSIITSDLGIYEKAIAANLDCLLIRPGYILLDGMDYGFIGGCVVAYDTQVFFNGDVTLHPDYNLIHDFITSKNLKIEYVEGPLRDIGSFIIL